MRAKPMSGIAALALSTLATSSGSKDQTNPRRSYSNSVSGRYCSIRITSTVLTSVDRTWRLRSLCAGRGTRRHLQVFYEHGPSARIVEQGHRLDTINARINLTVDPVPLSWNRKFPPQQQNWSVHLNGRTAKGHSPCRQ